MIEGPIVTGLGLVLALGFRLAGRQGFYGVCKMIAATGYLWTALSAGAFQSGNFGVVVFSGLVLGWFGDLFLISNAKKVFLMGLVSFLIGHLAYAVAFLLHGPDWRLVVAATFPVVILGAGFHRWLGVSAGDSMRRPVLAYISIITVMTVLGIGMVGQPAWPWLVAGSLLFYASDIGVALDRFKPRRIPAYLWSLPLYFAGQTCFALSIASSS